MEFVVYVLYSFKTDRLYIGYTSALIERFHWHNEKSKKGFTTRFSPWFVIAVEFFQSKKEAIKRERFLKSGMGRNFIRKEILPFFLP